MIQNLVNKMLPQVVLLQVVVEVQEMLPPMQVLVVLAADNLVVLDLPVLELLDKAMLAVLVLTLQLVLVLAVAVVRVQ
jgi:hypothetical protein